MMKNLRLEGSEFLKASEMMSHQGENHHNADNTCLLSVAYLATIFITLIVKGSSDLGKYHEIATIRKSCQT